MTACQRSPDPRGGGAVPTGAPLTRQFLAVAVALALRPTVASEPAIRFTDITPETGITFRHTDGSSGKRYIVETVSAGLALFDYDQDGDVDLYFLNGAPLGEGSGVQPRNALYRNEGNWRFVDVTDQSGAGDTGYGLGVAVADYDNDGDADIYLNNHGPNVLYRNNGNGTFTDETDSAGVGNGSKTGAGTCFLDIDRDGDLDLYVANYITFSPETHVNDFIDGVATYAGPLSYPAAPDTLFRNNGDGTFTDVSEASGIAGHAGAGMGVIAADFDFDGDTDIFVANDISCGNFLFVNDGKGRFVEQALLAGVAYDLHGDEQGSMGVECGDYNNDGLPDFYVTSYQRQPALLYENRGDGLFEDVTRVRGAGLGTFPNVTWGSALADFNQDGFRDLFVACGHLLDNIAEFDTSSTYAQKNVLLLNDGRGRFRDISDEAGDGMQARLSSRGAAFDDLDGDGDLDVVILNARERPTLLRNDTASKGHWLKVRLTGVASNRDGVGTRVTVTADDLMLIDEVHSGRGYQSHYGTCLHFGLGGREKVARLEVRWPSGQVDVLTDVPVDELLGITEGRSPTVRAE